MSTPVHFCRSLSLSDMKIGALTYKKLQTTIRRAYPPELKVSYLTTHLFKHKRDNSSH